MHFYLSGWKINAEAGSRGDAERPRSNFSLCLTASALIFSTLVFAIWAAFALTAMNTSQLGLALIISGFYATIYKVGFHKVGGLIDRNEQILNVYLDRFIFATRTT